MTVKIPTETELFAWLQNARMAVSDPAASRIVTAVHNVTSYPEGAVPGAKMAGEEATVKHVRLLIVEKLNDILCMIFT